MTHRELYISYVNDFLTVARFAEYYGLDEFKARELIARERGKDAALQELKK
tara:strand:- start:45 stop:197 length:153 start_codon:yes stop_codon:yes gene_type:complete